MLATNADETSERIRISRPRPLNPKGKHLNSSVDRLNNTSLNEKNGH